MVLGIKLLTKIFERYSNIIASVFDVMVVAVLTCRHLWSPDSSSSSVSHAVAPAGMSESQERWASNHHGPIFVLMQNREQSSLGGKRPLQWVAEQTSRYSGADLHELATEAARHSVRQTTAVLSSLRYVMCQL